MQRLVRYLIGATALLLPGADAALAEAQVLNTISQRFLHSALAALPAAKSMPHPAPWNVLADADVRERMDHIHRSVTDAFAKADGVDELSFKNYLQLDWALRSPSVPFDPERLAGHWQCRKIMVYEFGVIAYPYFRCAIRRSGECLAFIKMTGSQRFAGCLHALDTLHLAFVGHWHTDLDAGPMGGFVSASSSRRLRMIEPDPEGITVYDVIREESAP